MQELRNLNLELEDHVKQRTADLEHSETRIRAILENVGEGIISIDEKGEIESINPAAEKIFGLKRDDAVGVPGTNLLNDEADNPLVLH